MAEGIEWAEGPLWDTRTGSLLFSDVPRNAVFRWTQDAGVTLFLDKSGYSGKVPFTGREPGSNGLAFDREGRLVMCQHGDRRIARREKDGRLTVLADRYQGHRLNSPNDLVYRSDGSLYFTDPPFGLPGAFADPATVRGLFEGSAFMGLALSPDGRSIAVAVSARDQGVPPVQIIPIAGGTPRGLGAETEPRAIGQGIAWSPDGRWVWFTRFAELWRVPAGGGPAQHMSLPLRATPMILRVSAAPDGSMAASTQRWINQQWVMRNIPTPAAKR